MRKFPNRSKGFTLIEVLIAATILFISVSAMTLVYRTASISSITASKNVSFSGSVGLILNTIKSEVRGSNATSPQSGSGHIAGTDYSWQTELVSKSAPPSRFDVDSGNWVTPPDRFYLWKVELKINNESKEKNYNFKEISWAIR